MNSELVLSFEELSGIYRRAPSEIHGVLETVLEARKFGVRRHANGAIELNYRDRWNPGEMRAFHTIYPPLRFDVVETLERDLGLRFENNDAFTQGVEAVTGCPCVLQFSRKFKQLLMFSSGLSLFGGHMGYCGIAPLTRDARNPGPKFLPQNGGIVTLNIFLRPKRLDPKHAVISSYPADGSCVVVDPDNEETYRVTRDGEKLNRWIDPFDYLVKEVQRMCFLFDEDCQALTMKTAPPN